MPKFRFNHMELSFARGTLTPEFRDQVDAFYGDVLGGAHSTPRSSASSATSFCPTTASSSCSPRARSRCRRRATTTSAC